MKDLIAALTILLKYGNPKNPTHCEHDVLHVAIDAEVSKEDLAELDRLGFFPDEEYGTGFRSYRFGSC